MQKNRLNNKGMTIIEVLVCFVIVSVVMMSLFSTISAFNERRIEESYRAKMYSFKNEWTSKLQEDFIKKGLSFAKVSKLYDAYGVTNIVDCTLKTGEKRQLKIYQRFTLTSKKIDGKADVSDKFYLEYGDPDEGLFHEELPDLGKTNWKSKTKRENITEYRSSDYVIGEDKKNLLCKVDPNSTDPEYEQCYSYDLQINNVEIIITNEEDQTSNDHVLHIYIGFYHPNFGTKYGIDVICPIDYQGTNTDTSAYFPQVENERDKNKGLYFHSE